MSELEDDYEGSDGLAERIFELLGYEVNLSSPRAVQRVLAEDLSLPLTGRNKVGFRVDAESLEELQKDHPHEVVGLLLRWRAARAAERQKAASSSRASMKDLIDYDEIAKIMDVKVQTVRVYAVRDEDFPPVVSMVGRTPLRSRKALAKYLKLREIRNSGLGGRPPRPAGGVG